MTCALFVHPVGKRIHAHLTKKMSYWLCDLVWKRVVSFLLDYQETHRRKFSFAPLLKYRTTQLCIPYVRFPPPRFHSLGQELFSLHSLETYVLSRTTMAHPLEAVSCIYVPHKEAHGSCPYSMAEIKHMWTSRGGV
jgi:hypothetical protein